MFKRRSLRTHMLETFVEHAGVLLERLAAVSEGAVVDIQRHFAALTLDCIGRIAFGVSIGSQTDDGVQFGPIFDRLQRRMIQVPGPFPPLSFAFLFSC